MVVLVNQNSASAAEIVSACLQDHKRAKVVGQRTYGKGSVQNIIELEDGNSVLKLTVATYHRPSGKNIHRFKNAKPSDEWGVSPDPAWRSSLAPAAITRTGSSAAATATPSRIAPAQEPPSRTRRRRSRQKPTKDEGKGRRCQGRRRRSGRPSSGHPRVFVDRVLEQGGRGDQGRARRSRSPRTTPAHALRRVCGLCRDGGWLRDFEGLAPVCSIGEDSDRPWFRIDA